MNISHTLTIGKPNKYYKIYMKDIERIQIHIEWRLIIVSININVDEDNTDDYDDVHTSLSVSSSEQKLFFYTKINKTKSRNN